MHSSAYSFVEKRMFFRVVSFSQDLQRFTVFNGYFPTFTNVYRHLAMFIDIYRCFVLFVFSDLRLLWVSSDIDDEQVGAFVVLTVSHSLSCRTVFVNHISLSGLASWKDVLCCFLQCSMQWRDERRGGFGHLPDLKMKRTCNKICSFEKQPWVG